MVIMGAPVLKRFKWNGVIFLGDPIHKKIAFHVYLERMNILQIIGNVDKKNALLNWVMYFSFANAFFPSIFPQIRQSLSRFVQYEWREDILLFF